MPTDMTPEFIPASGFSLRAIAYKIGVRMKQLDEFMLKQRLHQALQKSFEQHAFASNHELIVKSSGSMLRDFIFGPPNKDLSSPWQALPDLLKRLNKMPDKGAALWNQVVAERYARSVTKTPEHSLQIKLLDRLIWIPACRNRKNDILQHNETMAKIDPKHPFRVVIKGVPLRSIDLTGYNLSGGHYDGVQFFQVKMGADFTGSCILDCTFSSCLNIGGADFTGAKVSKGTSFCEAVARPIGFVDPRSTEKANEAASPQPYKKFAHAPATTPTASLNDAVLSLKNPGYLAIGTTPAASKPRRTRKTPRPS